MVPKDAVINNFKSEIKVFFLLISVLIENK